MRNKYLVVALAVLMATVGFFILTACECNSGGNGGGGGTPSNGGGGGTPPPSNQPAKAELTWSGAGDLDLEVWTEDGMTYLASGYDYTSPDITMGGGTEFLVFDNKYDRDLSQGGWTISVGNAVDSIDCNATVNVTLPNGTVRTFSTTVPGDAWHWDVCRIYPSQNRVEEINQIYYESFY